MNWRSRNKKRTVPLIVWALLLIVALSLLEWGTDGLVRTTTRDMFAGVWSTVAQVETAVGESGVLHTRAALAKENAALKEERDQLRTMQLQNDVLRAENAALRVLLGVQKETAPGTAARVLSRPTVSPYGTFIIERPSEAVVPGSVVLIAPTVAIGEVTEAGAQTALVSLYSAPSVERDVFIGENALVYHGLGSGNGYIDAPRALTFEKGMVVRDTTTGFALGAVGAIESTPESATQRLRVGPAANLPALQFVLVVPKL